MVWRVAQITRMPSNHLSCLFRQKWQGLWGPSTKCGCRGQSTRNMGRTSWRRNARNKRQPNVRNSDFLFSGETRILVCKIFDSLRANSTQQLTIRAPLPPVAVAVPVPVPVPVVTVAVPVPGTASPTAVPAASIAVIGWPITPRAPDVLGAATVRILAASCFGCCRARRTRPTGHHRTQVTAHQHLVLRDVAHSRHPERPGQLHCCLHRGVVS